MKKKEKKYSLPACFKKDFFLVLAPLAGYTDLSFRMLCREFGADMCVTEMVSSNGLVYKQKRTWHLLRSVERDRPLSVQLFGSEPEVMGRAAAMITAEQADIIDINMGCPVRKVIKRGAGSALMKDMQLAEGIIRQVVEQSALPVTVKFRSGWRDDSINAPEFAEMVESAGAAALTIHARTWAQGFGGRADWQIIKQVKERVRIPVIGNGDVLSYTDALRMASETGCNGVMIGRGALGNPWAFSTTSRPTTLAGLQDGLLRFMDIVEKFYDEKSNVVYRVKYQAARFIKGVPGATDIRKKIMGCRNLNELRELLK